MLMDLLEIKNQLHKKIDMIENEELLLEALHLLEHETELQELVLPNELVDKIESAKIEKINGLFMEHTEANKQVKKWLSEKLIDSSIDKFNNMSKDPKDEITPLVKSLTGIIALPKKHEFKKMYKEHLIKKYS